MLACVVLVPLASVVDSVTVTDSCARPIRALSAAPGSLIVSVRPTCPCAEWRAGDVAAAMLALPAERKPDQPLDRHRMAPHDQ